MTYLTLNPLAICQQNPTVFIKCSVKLVRHPQIFVWSFYMHLNHQHRLSLCQLLKILIKPL
nr:hypothetical protein Iba_chr15aCG9000 [Ipomoea batatas]